MIFKGIDLERLSEHVSVVFRRDDVLYNNLAVGYKLSDLQETTLNVPRALARFHIP